jgi:hypothetical protein
MKRADEAAVRSEAESFLEAFVTQDFDAMWALTDEETKKRVGMLTFVRQLNYVERGVVLSSKVESVGGLGPDRALVHTAIVFQWAPSLFDGADMDPVTLDWSDEWVRRADGKWYRVIPSPDPEELRIHEEVCANAVRESQRQISP